MSAIASISPIPAQLEPLISATPKNAELATQKLEAEKEKKAFQDFEEMFVGMMLKEMRKSTNRSSLTEKSHATKMYEEMMDESLAKQMAGSGQLGVADQLYDMVKGERIRAELRGNERNMTRNALEPIKA